MIKTLLGLVFVCSLYLTASCKDTKTVNGLSNIDKSSGMSDFAPSLWLDRNTYKGSFSDDYNTFYFFRKAAPNSEKYIPYVAEFKNGQWQDPIIADYFQEQQSYTYQLKVPNTNELIFIANTAVEGDTSSNPNYNFWKTAIADNGYNAPRELGYKNIIYNYNSQPCITNSGNIYFTSNTPDWRKTLSYKMEASTEGYKEPQLFAPLNQWRAAHKNWTIHEFTMAPKEDFMIICIQEKSEAVSLNTDLYISYPTDNGWTTPEKLAAIINTSETENFPYITADGKYLMFTRAFSKFQIIPLSTLVKEM